MPELETLERLLMIAADVQKNLDSYSFELDELDIKQGDIHLTLRGFKVVFTNKEKANGDH